MTQAWIVSPSLDFAPLLVLGSDLSPSYSVHALGPCEKPDNCLLTQHLEDQRETELQQVIGV